MTQIVPLLILFVRLITEETSITISKTKILQIVIYVKEVILQNETQIAKSETTAKELDAIREQLRTNVILIIF